MICRIISGVIILYLSLCFTQNTDVHPEPRYKVFQLQTYFVCSKVRLTGEYEKLFEIM